MGKGNCPLHVSRLLFVTMIIWLSSCSNIIQERTTNVPPNTDQATVVQTLQPTQSTRTPTPDNSKPARTMTTSLNQVLTPKSTNESITEIPTITVEPTLNAIEKERAVRWLLEEDGPCMFPCFGGIHPGRTSVETAMKAFVEKGFTWSKAFPAIKVPGKTYWTSVDLSSYDVSISTSIITLRDQNKVDAIFVGISGSEIREFAPFYDMPNLIETLGIPDQVTLSMQYTEGSEGTGYDIWVYYNKGMAIKFVGYAVMERDSLLVCPKNPLKFYEDKTGLGALYGESIYLQDPDSERKLVDLVGLWGVGGPQWTWSLDQAANLSNADFYNLMIGISQQECFETPSELWISK